MMNNIIKSKKKIGLNIFKRKFNEKTINTCVYKVC